MDRSEEKPRARVFLLKAQNELKRKKNPISNVCLGGCTITSKTKIKILGPPLQKISKNVDISL